LPGRIVSWRHSAAYFHKQCAQSALWGLNPEPIANNLGPLITAVKRTKADIGIALDGDADRIV